MKVTLDAINVSPNVTSRNNLKIISQDTLGETISIFELADDHRPASRVLRQFGPNCYRADGVTIDVTLL